MSNRSQGMRTDDRNDDKPPYSRIFVVCGKQLQEDDLRPAFERFGHIDDLHMPRDRNTGDSKGIAYIKYDKTSSAASAIEGLHMTTINNHDKPIKVMVATHRSDGHNTNENKYKRLFIKVHKDITESEIRQHFALFGRVESVRLQRDKLTNECKGFAYVHFKTFLDAAKAFEECDTKYKPIFATPKDDLKRTRNSFEHYDSFHSSHSNMHKDNYFHDHYYQPRDDMHKNLTTLMKTQPENYDTVYVACSPFVPQKHIESLFNIVPGMVQCKYTVDSFNGFCKAVVSYESEKAAAYAVEKLNNFEFPSGEIVSVKPDESPLNKAANNLTSIVNTLRNGTDSNPNLLQLADAIAQASTLIKAATSIRESKVEGHDNYCSVSLPPIQPMASTGSSVAQRCFIVFKPHPPPISMLRDTFCRFGDLIEVSTFPNKTFGFAKYASARAAQEAINTLHGATLCGVKLKVLEADEKPTKEDKLQKDEENRERHDDDIERKRMKLNDKENCTELE